MRRQSVDKALVVALALLVPGAGLAGPAARWELGAGVVALRLPDYRGSAQSRSYVYPLPYFVYHGEVLRVDREGARARFFELGGARLDFSAHATPPVDSERNRARQGMANLDPTLEIGPMLSLALAQDERRGRRLDLRLPVRAVIATNLSHAQAAGFVFYPHLNADRRLAGWNLGMQAGPLFATARYHRYFYGVPPAFATPARPAYAARSGYSGFTALASLSRRVHRLWMAGFVRYDALAGAAFASSPLVERNRSLMAGLAVAWVFVDSDARVDVTE